MTNTTARTPGPWCSFCGLEKAEVERMFDGPAAHICGDCVVLMEGMLHEPERPAFRPLADFKAELERLRVEYGPHRSARAALAKARQP